MMRESLARLAALPPETRVFRPRRYTAANLKLAAAVEPDNEAVEAARRGAGVADHAVDDRRGAGDQSVPCGSAEPAVIAAARRAGRPRAIRRPCSGAIRAWKNEF